MAKDYYEILGIRKNASQEDIRRAYKKLAKQFHPDVNREKDAEQKFKETQHAYSVLSDEAKRRNYDQFGHEAERFSGASGARGFEGNFSGADFEDIFGGFGFGGGFSDLFGEAFGGPGRRGPQGGEDIAVRLNISFEEAAFGAEKQLEIDAIQECEHCEGSGARPGTKVEGCDNCNGSGIERQTRRTFIGVISTQSTCRKCRGSGQMFSSPCPVCSGNGRMHKHKKIKVNVPAGVNTGNSLRLKGQGNAGERGASKGDLIAVIYAEPHEVFRRDGSDIFMEAPISFPEAALGSEVEVPTLKGKAKLKIPSGTQSGTIFRMHGKGIKKLGEASYGDEFVKVIVKTPEKVSKKQRELLEKLAEEDETAKNRKGFFGRLKGMFE